MPDLVEVKHTFDALLGKNYGSVALKLSEDMLTFDRRALVF